MERCIGGETRLELNRWYLKHKFQCISMKRSSLILDTSSLKGSIGFIEPKKPSKSSDLKAFLYFSDLNRNRIYF